MQGTKSVENVLDEIINAEFGNDQKIESVSVVSKSGLIITGDPSQVDLPAHKRSGLIEALHILRKIDGIAFNALVNPETLKVKNRNIDTQGDFYNMLRSLEENFAQ